MQGIKCPLISLWLTRTADIYHSKEIEMARLINLTMTKAQPVEELGSLIFGNLDPDYAARAVTTLIALGSLARSHPESPGLLPCRVHSFYRGMAGIWVCMDPGQ